MSGLYDKIDDMVSGVTGSGEVVYNFTFYSSGEGFSPFNMSNTQVFGKLTIAGTNRYNIELMNHANVERFWRGTKLNENWTWAKIAFST